MTNKKKVMKMRRKPTTKDKSVKTDAVCQVSGDRLSWSLSYEPFNGCWVGFSYESDVQEGETLDGCKDRVWDYALQNLTEKAEEFASQNQEGDDD
jgi:hypothetical protein